MINIGPVERENMNRVIEEIKRRNHKENDDKADNPTLITELFNSILYWLGLY